MNTYTVVFADVSGSTTYRVSARDADDAMRLAWYARNKNDVTSVTSITLTKL